ncbi:hypothetical protein AA101099_1865 [Neoasaia chiangmaiensis NBRC 101099]|uniref:Uncharacterized protein n=1 Tax=Neoasaia chiangmaiensis TaxID=320497 RepID=A0A1U9KQR1_9PROT|nr:hypothetical protein [Neoasaia chiangmaiensis]AQS88194.1 hypothetical protein A0U93_09840 [Neoasaia chiangmaiensis]GBR39893.1 hypothetical protein AA101099_1865 [Neoasaia chiangmaiensis NBRC 101099]GEN14789.1 hypothetical protein NCH01_12200 [Neoasaia chiangmaiensis]
MTDENFELWLAKEKRVSADARYAEAVTTLERVKSRASAFLGWTLTLGSASTAYALHGEGYWIAAACAAVFFGAAAVQSFRVLYSTKWLSKNASPDGLDEVLRGMTPQTEANGTLWLAHASNAATEKNIGYVIHDQALLRQSWKLALSGALLSALVGIATSQPLRQVFWHMIEGHLPGL